MCDSGYRDVDIVITTRELGRMIREAGIDFASLPEGEFDSPLGYRYRCSCYLWYYRRRYGGCFTHSS